MLFFITDMCCTTIHSIVYLRAKFQDTFSYLMTNNSISTSLKEPYNKRFLISMINKELKGHIRSRESTVLQKKKALNCKFQKTVISWLRSSESLLVLLSPVLIEVSPPWNCWWGQIYWVSLNPAQEWSPRSIWDH